MSGQKNTVRIWVDADACPRAVKDVIYRAARRTQVLTTFVANQMLLTPPSPYIKALQVPAGMDVADNEIVLRLAAEDLVITADIPLAALVVAKGGFALNPRGELYTADTIRERLSMRDFMDSLRATGVETGGPAMFRQKDKQTFANQLDRFLSIHFRRIQAE